MWEGSEAAIQFQWICGQEPGRSNVPSAWQPSTAGEKRPNIPRLEEQGIRVETVAKETPSRAARRKDQLASFLTRTPFEPYTTRSREMQDAIDRLFAERPFDAVQLESTLV